MAILDWTGISVPFRIENGSVAKSKSLIGVKYIDSPHISESIRTIIKTNLGEWITKKHIGNKFRKVVFDLFTDDFDVYIQHNLAQSIETEDNRVKIIGLSIERFPDDNLIKISVKWDINPDILSEFSNPNSDGYTTTVDIPVGDYYVSKGGEQ